MMVYQHPQIWCFPRKTKACHLGNFQIGSLSVRHPLPLHSVWKMRARASANSPPFYKNQGPRGKKNGGVSELLVDMMVYEYLFLYIYIYVCVNILFSFLQQYIFACTTHRCTSRMYVTDVGFKQRLATIFFQSNSREQVGPYLSYLVGVKCRRWLHWLHMHWTCKSQCSSPCGCALAALQWLQLTQGIMF